MWVVPQIISDIVGTIINVTTENIWELRLVCKNISLSILIVKGIMGSYITFRLQWSIKLMEKILLTILTGKGWCFTQFSTGMAGWLLLIFFTCLHNQLSSRHSIVSTDVWKMWLFKYTVKMDGCFFQQVQGKTWVSFCLNTGKHFFLVVSFSSQ